MKLMYVVYKIECLVTNQVYIGSTKNYKKRIAKHKNDLIKNKHYNKYLQDSFNKFGLDNFTFTILEKVNDRLTALNLEDYWIDYYGGIETIMTYNMQNNTTKNVEYGKKISKAKVGNIPWNKNRKMTLTAIEKNRQSHIGIKRSSSSIMKQKQAIANNPNFGNRGKKLSEQTKAKISKANKNRIPYNKGKRNSIHKYDDMIGILQEEYQQYKSYAMVQRLHPTIHYDVVRSLIMFGTTDKKPIK